MTAPFPWSSLPRVDRRAPRTIAVAQQWLTWAGVGSVMIAAHGGPDLIDLGITGASIRGIGARAQLEDPTAYAVRVRKGSLSAHVVVPGRLVRAVAQRLLGGPDELDAPRPLTRIERAVVPVAVAAVLDRLGADQVEVDADPVSGALVPDTGAPSPCTILAVEVHGAATATVALVLPFELPAPPPRALAEIASGRHGWLDAAPACLNLVLGWARLGRSEFKALRARDVVVATAGIRLVGARGRFEAALARTTGRITVLSSYRRGAMDETLGDDATIDLAVAVGEIRLSVRSLLELRPGNVLELGRPVGSAVELRIGDRVVGRGELVDVDGEVGVRVLSLESTSP